MFNLFKKDKSKEIISKNVSKNKNYLSQSHLIAEEFKELYFEFYILSKIQFEDAKPSELRFLSSCFTLQQFKNHNTGRMVQTLQFVKPVYFRNSTPYRIKFEESRVNYFRSIIKINNMKNTKFIEYFDHRSTKYMDLCLKELKITPFAKEKTIFCCCELISRDNINFGILDRHFISWLLWRSDFMFRDFIYKALKFRNYKTGRQAYIFENNLLVPDGILRDMSSRKLSINSNPFSVPPEFRKRLSNIFNKEIELSDELYKLESNVNLDIKNKQILIITHIIMITLILYTTSFDHSKKIESKPFQINLSDFDSEESETDDEIIIKPTKLEELYMESINLHTYQNKIINPRDDFTLLVNLDHCTFYENDKTLQKTIALFLVDSGNPKSYYSIDYTFKILYNTIGKIDNINDNFVIVSELFKSFQLDYKLEDLQGNVIAETSLFTDKRKCKLYVSNWSYYPSLYNIKNKMYSTSEIIFLCDLENEQLGFSYVLEKNTEENKAGNFLTQFALENQFSLSNYLDDDSDDESDDSYSKDETVTETKIEMGNDQRNEASDLYPIDESCDVTGNGLCGAYCIFLILMDSNKFMRLGDIIEALRSMPPYSRQWWYAHTLAMFCEEKGIRLIVVNDTHTEHRGRVEVDNKLNAENYLIYANGVHFRPLLKRLENKFYYQAEIENMDYDNRDLKDQTEIKNNVVEDNKIASIEQLQEDTEVAEITQNDTIKLSWADEVEAEMEESQSAQKSGDSSVFPKANWDTGTENNNDGSDHINQLDNNDTKSVAESDGNSSESETELDDESDIEDTVCCRQPALLGPAFSQLLIDTIDQFDDNSPEYTCLRETFKNIHIYLRAVNESTSVSSLTALAVNKCLKFRHNYFAYIYLKEVIGRDVRFNTDQQFRYIDYKKTPDYLEYNDDNMTLKVFEFSVVGNLLRGNFQKGFNLENSKYHKEIKIQQDNGYTVSYYPVILSTSENLEINVLNLSKLGFEIEENFTNELHNYLQILDNSVNNVYSMGFEIDLNRQWPEADEYINSKLKNNSRWHYTKVKGNKRKFYFNRKTILNYKFETGYYYNLIHLKNNKITIRQTNNLKLGLSGDLILNNLNDDFFIYNWLFPNKTGNDTFFIATTKELGDSEFTNDSKHGILMNGKREELNYNTDRNKEVFGKQESLSTISKFLSNPMEGINNVCTIDDVKLGLKYLSDYQKMMSTPNYYSKPPILNAPRRSFISLLNPNDVDDIEYTKGVVFYGNIEDCRSNAVKLLYPKFKNIIYEKRIVVETEESKNVYKQSMYNIYNFIDELKSKGFKIEKDMSFRRIKNMLDLETKIKFDEIIEKNRKLQIEYMKKSSKTDSHGTLPIDKTVRDMIKKEMSWGSSKGYKVYMGEAPDIQSLFELLKNKTRNIKINLQFPDNAFDCNLFKDLKKYSLDELKVVIDSMSTTALFQNLNFLSRLAYTLMASSSRNFNSKKMLIDNLGLTNTILCIKGGKKINSTRKSKIFKLIYPCQPSTQFWNIDNTFVSSQTMYDETNWMQLNQTTLADMISLPYKFLCNMAGLSEKYTICDSMSILCVPTLLAINNRRKTEQYMHNMRYLIVNPMGDMNRISEMLKEFKTPAYSPFDKVIMSGLMRNYEDYFKSVKEWLKLETNEAISFQQSKVQHPYLNRDIMNIDDMTYIIYSTYMMSKGQYNQVVEQTLNLSSIMETHDDYMNSKYSHFYDYFDKDQLLNDDFSYSKSLSYTVGKYLSAELKSRHAINKLNSGWNQFLNEPIDNMANNRGLRYKGKDFFGHKGYFVIYKELFDRNPQKVLEIINSGEDLSKVYRRLHDINQTFQTEQEITKLNKVIMHVVDKDQRAGRREIYVMDYNTKLYQNPIEKMFKLICSFIDNEIITVPSARRAGLIHKKVFEFQSEKYETYYMTLDCRKWAPRSNPDKYIYMILGMRDVLPPDFIRATITYFLKHNEKEIHTRKVIKETLLKNEGNARFARYFQDDHEKESSYFNMPYSFVMGIFNMLSSLFHAGAQIMSCDLIGIELLEQNINMNFHMLAHSDDSAGRLSIQKVEKIDILKHMKRMLGQYESLQKGCNHMMSLKKCVISKYYFELLSILYVNHQLLPLLPKFLGNVSITFTGSGLSTDFKQIISKSIEIQTNGATLSHAYKCQIILSNLYKNFYRVTKETYLPSLGGFANSWPSLYLSFGAAADEVVQSIFNPDFFGRFISFCLKNLDYEIYEGSINLKYKNILRKPKAYQNFGNLIKLPEFSDSQWFFSQNKTRHSLLNVYWFRAMLDDPSFQISLLNINEIRRTIDSLYMASGSNILGKFINYNINDLIMLIYDHEGLENNYYDLFKKTHRKLISYYEWLQETNNYKIVNKPDLSYKPSSLTVPNFAESPIQNFNSLELATQLCNPELMKYLYRNRMFGQEIKSMKEYLMNLGVPQDIKFVKNFLDLISKFKTKTVFLYCPTMSNHRVFDDLVGLHDLSCINFTYGKMVQMDVYSLVKPTAVHGEITQEVTSIIDAYYLYSAYVQSKDEDLSKTIINLNGRNIELNSIPSSVYCMDAINYCQFLPLIEKQDGASIILNNLNNWAFWTDRQVKIGNDWVGPGNLRIKINFYIDIKVKNSKIIEVHQNSDNLIKYDQVQAGFIKELFKEFNLNYLNYVHAIDGQNYFGIDYNNILGIHDSTEIKLGVPCITNSNLDTSNHSVHNDYIFDRGNHYIKIRGYNVKIHTIDNTVFNKKKSNMLKLIDWENTPKFSAQRLLNILFKGRYGEISFIEYDRQDLMSKMLETDIYRLYYNNCVKNNSTLYNVFWEDMLTNLTVNEEMFPTLYESLGIEQLVKLLPSNQRDNLALYLFFEQTDEEILKFRRNINMMNTTEEKFNYYARLSMKIKDYNGMLALPEIGDPKEFEKWEFKKDKKDNLPDFYLVDAINVLSEAIHVSIIHLNQDKLNKLMFNLNITNTDLSTIISLFVGEINKGFKAHDTIALTSRSMFLHEVVTMIFDSKLALGEFSRGLRKTILSRLPRHPSYVNDYHQLIASVYKRMNSRVINMNNISSTWVRKNILKRKLPDFIEKVEILPEYITNAGSASFRKLHTAMPISYYDSLMNDVADLDFDRDNINNIDTALDDIIDDNELDIKLKHKQKRRRILLVDSSNYSVFSSDIIDNFAICTDIYYPCIKDLYTIKIKDCNYFIYNLNEDIAKNLALPKLRKNFLNKLYYKYIKQYYTISHGIFESTRDTVKEVVELKQASIESYITYHKSPSDQRTYNDELVSYLVDTYSLDEEGKAEVSDIVFSKLPSIMKFNKLKEFIRSNSRTKKEDDILSSFFEKWITEESNKSKGGIDLIPEKTELKKTIIEQDQTNQIHVSALTTYKKEYQQLDSILKNTYKKLLNNSIVLSEFNRNFLLNTCKLMLNNIKRFDKNRAATARIIIDILKDCKVGQQNREGTDFEELIKSMINELNTIEDETEEEIDEPVYNLEGFKFKLG
jgi:hypothetical protein